MDILLIILGICCLLISLVGCFIPAIPGPPTAYFALVLLHFTDSVQFTLLQLFIWLTLVVVLQVLDYFVPTISSKYGGGSRWGIHGCLAGTLLGFFFLPWGIFIGPFIGALVGELAGGYGAKRALKSSSAVLAGFLMGTAVKCMCCGYFIWKFAEAAMA